MASWKRPTIPYLTGLDDLEGVKGEAIEAATDGWIGFTDHYWMTTLIPEQGKPFTAVSKYTPGADIYQVEVRQPLLSIAPGATATTSIQLFAGAKEWETIHAYQNDPSWLDWLLGDRVDPGPAANRRALSTASTGAGSFS